MKRFIRKLTLFGLTLFFVKTSIAQLSVSNLYLPPSCQVPPLYGDVSSFMIAQNYLNQLHYTYYDDSYGDTHGYFQVDCNASSESFLADFDGAWNNKNVEDCSDLFERCGKYEIKMEVRRQKFDCNGNFIGSPQLLYTSPIVEIAASLPFYTFNTGDLAVEPMYSYYATIYERYEPVGDSWDPWSSHTEGPVSFLPPLSIDGHFNDVVSTESRTSTGTGWSVDVHLLDPQVTTLTFDASASSYENSWTYEISAFDLDSWTASGTESFGPVAGEASLANLNTYYTPGIQTEQLYMLKLLLGPGYCSEYYWFELKGAGINCSLSNDGVVYQTTIGGETYELFELCYPSPVHLNTAGTEYESKYRITIQAVDGSYTPIETGASTGWVTSPVAAGYDMGTIYGTLLNNQRYKVTYEVGDPELSLVKYFRYKTCTGRLKSEVDKSELNLYPNPVNSYLNIHLDREVAQEITIRVINAEGKEVLNTSSNQSMYLLDTSSLPEGFYLISILEGDTVFTTRKILIQH